MVVAENRSPVSLETERKMENNNYDVRVRVPTRSRII